MLAQKQKEKYQYKWHRRWNWAVHRSEYAALNRAFSEKNAVTAKSRFTYQTNDSSHWNKIAQKSIFWNKSQDATIQLFEFLDKSKTI
jgi:hypothetical protein